MDTSEWAVPDHPETDDEAAWVAWSDALEVNRVLGLEMTALHADGASFVIERARMRNSRDDLHGGLLLAVADQCAGIATKRGVPGAQVQCVTASSGAQFLSPGSVPLTVDARVTKHGRRLAFVAIEATNAAGEPCLLGQWTLGVKLV